MTPLPTVCIQLVVTLDELETGWRLLVCLATRGAKLDGLMSVRGYLIAATAVIVIAFLALSSAGAISRLLVDEHQTGPPAELTQSASPSPASTRTPNPTYDERLRPRNVTAKHNRFAGEFSDENPTAAARDDDLDEPRSR